MVKLSIFEKYAVLPKFWQRNLNPNNESSDTRSEDMELSDGSAYSDHRTSNLRSVCQENDSLDHRAGNEGSSELGNVDCRENGAMGNAVTEGFTEEEPLAKGPEEDSMSLCNYTNAEASPLTCDEVLENSDCQVSSNIQDEDIDRRKNLADGDDHDEDMDKTAWSSQDDSFKKTFEVTKGEPSNMDGSEVTLADTPEGSMDEVVDHTPESDDLCNSDQENLKNFEHKAIYSCSMEDEMEESDGDDKYEGYWKIYMKNEVRMVISKAKRKTKSTKKKSGNRSQRKRIKLKLRLS